MIFFSEPFPAKCTDRLALSKSHPHSGGPQDWFADKVLAQHNLYGLSFDFFVNWTVTPPALSPVIWIKKVLSSKHDYPQVQRHLNTIMALELGDAYFQRLEALKKAHNLKIQFIIFHDHNDWVSTQSSLLIATFNGFRKGVFDFSAELISILDFQSVIQRHSGGPIRIGSKGLTFGTSNLECYLSRTNSLYPGDVDLIIFDEKHKPIALLEYKKHNLKSPISNQQLANYYPRPDGKKYNRLAILRDYLAKSGATIPLLVVYFPTRSAFTEGRLEVLKGTFENLETEMAFNFRLPVMGSLTDYKTLINMLLKTLINRNA